MQRALHVGRLRQGEPEHCGLHGEEIVEKAIRLVDACACARLALDPRGGADVVDMRMRVDDRLDTGIEVSEARADGLQVSAGIDHDGALAGAVHHDGAVAAEGTRGKRLEVHVTYGVVPSRRIGASGVQETAPAPKKSVVREGVSVAVFGPTVDGL